MNLRVECFGWDEDPVLDSVFSNEPCGEEISKYNNENDDDATNATPDGIQLLLLLPIIIKPGESVGISPHGILSFIPWNMYGVLPIAL